MSKAGIAVALSCPMIQGLPYRLLFLSLILLSGCKGEESGLTISAAADLSEAFGEVGKRFTDETGIAVRFNFGSTGQLAQQIEAGAPVDLFAAANIAFVEDLERKGRLLPESRRLYGQGRIVLWSREENRFPLTGIEDLLRPEVRRIAIANPEHAPYGMAAREALEKKGIWELLGPKLVPGENVRQVLRYAETGDVEVAIIARSLCQPGVGRWVLLPEELHRPLTQALGIVSSSQQREAATRFSNFLLGATGQKIMRRYGFVAPRERIGERKEE
jgi:molybdate transport system substrate-binding protein